MQKKSSLFTNIINNKQMINIVLHGQPIAKQRSRKGAQGHWYNPQQDLMITKSREIEQQLPEGFKKIEKDIPVVVNVYLFFSPSKSMSTKKFLKEIENDDIPHIIKPDRDNCDKFVLDCMSGIVFHDDCHIYGGEVYKCWSKNPRTEIEVIF